MPRLTSFLLLLSAVPALAQVVSYEGTSFPEEDGAWERIEVLYPADRWLDNGWLVQHTEVVEQPPPNLDVNEEDFYRRPLVDFTGVDSFFVEWHMETDGSAAGIPSVSPAALVLGGNLGVSYHFTIAEDQVLFRRDTSIPSVWVDIEPGVPHTYRLELLGTESYLWYIDGRLIDSGVPEGAYPTIDSRITFGARAPGEPATTRWDYVRLGVIPEPGAFAFLGAGTAILTARRRRRQRDIPQQLREFPH